MIVKRGNNYRLVSRKSDKPRGVYDTRQDSVQRNMAEGGMVEEWPPSGPIPLDEVLERQIYKESRGNPLAESPAGARGLAQIMPNTESYLREKGMIREDFDAFNPEHSREAQQAYMNSLLERGWNRGSDEIRYAKALAAYNFGPTATVSILNQAKEQGVDIYESLDWLEMLPLETRDYVSKILGYNDRFEDDYGSYKLRRN
jgi:membrane-bound lytic murein transglycosylase MltF